MNCNFLESSLVLSAIGFGFDGFEGAVNSVACAGILYWLGMEGGFGAA